jgi:uncharacterized protein YjiK
MRAFLLTSLLAVAFPRGVPRELPTPTAIVELPEELREVSGLTDIDDHTVACLQDEEATLYFVDIATGQVRERRSFGPPGDMEGLTRVGNAFYALRSDGLIYQVGQKGNRYSVVDSFPLHLPQSNIEGLGFDARNGLVLVAPKAIGKGNGDIRDRRSVFAFDTATHVLLPRPVLTYSVPAILRQAEASGISIPTRTTPKGKEVPLIKFRMSAVAVDPVSDHYFLLSAVDRSLLVLDRKGAFVALYLLDEKVLPQPEGITFLPNGDMLISSEGKEGPARLVRYPTPR